MKCLLSLLNFSLFLWSASAGPTGASACAAGTAAVGGQHLNADNGRVVTTGTLEEAPQGLRLVLITPNGETTFTPGSPVTLSEDLAEVRLTSTSGFKGFLIRLEGVQGALVPAQSALGNGTHEEDMHCPAAGASGLTHNDAELKQGVAGVIQDVVATNAGKELPLDVTVVITNKESSEYYHSTYTLLVAGDASSTTTDSSQSESTTTPATDPPSGSPRPHLFHISLGLGMVLFLVSTLIY
jgi:hypothetical protein